MKTSLTTWTIYDHPSDYPQHYVAREWLITPDGEVHRTESVMISEDLELLRESLLVEFGKTPLPRNVDDDPVIVETWL